MIMQWNKEDKEECIKRLAFCIWQKRKRDNEPDADNERVNYLRAKYCFYPEDMTIEEMQCVDWELIK